MKQKKAQWPWHLLTGLVLIGLAAAMYYATSLMSYEWRWNRVPQYFAYHAEESQRAADISTVSDLVRSGDKAEVTLRNDAGDEQRVTVDDNSLQVAQGDDVAEGDVIGVTRHWAAGPLLWGLWTTLWLSVVSGVLGLLTYTLQRRYLCARCVRDAANLNSAKPIRAASVNTGRARPRPSARD